MRSLLLGLVLLGAAGARAQPADSTVAPRFAPTLALWGSVSARALTVHTADRIAVRLVGTDTLRIDERDGLPDPVQPGARYENIRLDFRLQASPLIRSLLPELFGPDAVLREDDDG